MVNTIALQESCNRRGKKRGYVAKEMGISRASLWRKSRNMTDFTIGERELFCKVVGITTKAEKNAIFFADERHD